MRPLRLAGADPDPTRPARSIPRLFLTEPLRDLARPHEGTIPALDALRTCAVLLVVFGHASESYVARSGRQDLFSSLPFVRNGWIGVDLFFVLSGLLIGGQLWKELRATGGIDFPRFVLRRGLRIWPLYYCVFAFSVFVLGRGEFPFGRGWTDIVFLTNYINYGVVWGSWSLCTEEQFYLLAPLLVVLGASRGCSVAGYRKYLLWLILLLPLVRAVAWWRLTGGDIRRHDNTLTPFIYQPIHTHSDGLVVGLLIANLRSAGAGRDRAGLCASGWGLLLGAAAAAALWAAHREVFGYTGIALAFGSLFWYLLSGGRAWHAVFRPRFFYVISRLSFGIYLNHQFIIKAAYRSAGLAPPLADRLPALGNLATAVAFAAASAAVSVATFCLVEYPFLRLREGCLGGRASAPR
jgi:peptidoglycan/LPS O-acetylase OafA/YrhL